MKKLTILFALFAMFILVGCGSGAGETQNPEETTAEGAVEKTTSVEEQPSVSTEETLEAIAVAKLYEELLEKYGDESILNLEKTRYSIGSINEEYDSKIGVYYTVNGHFYLYDKYGDLHDGYYGSVKKRFSVYIFTDGYVSASLFDD